MSDTVLVERTGAIVRLTLNRPESANTINLELATTLRDAVRALDGDVRVVVLAGAGSRFCGGGDLREVALAADPQAHLAEMAEAFHESLLALDATDAVTIAEVGGAVAGGGLGLALHADVIVASDRARFLTAYERIGLTPDGGATDLLPRTIGLHRALELTATGRELDAATAHDWGLVTTLVPHEELAAHVTALAERLASAPTAHIAATARLYRAQPDDHAARLDEEAAAISSGVTRSPGREALASFTTPRSSA